MTEEQPPVSLRLLVALALAAMLAPLGSTMIAVALPDIGRDFATDPGALTQWLVTSYLVVNIVLQSPGGKVGDLWGHRRALAVGQSLVAVGALLGISAADLAMLVAARVLAAAGGALIVPATMAIVRQSLPAERRARAFALFSAVMGAAAGLGPIVGGELLARIGWRAIFAASLVPLALSVAFAAGGLRAATMTSPRRAVRLDVVGGALLGAALTALVVATKVGNAWVYFAGGGALLLAFVAWERQARDPVLALGLFTRRAFVLGGVVIGLQNLAMYALLFQLPYFFKDVRGVTSDRTGRVLLGLMAAQVVAAPVGARLAERAGSRVTIGAGAVLALAGLWLLRDLSALLTPLDALPGLLLFGLGLGLSTAPAQAAAMNAVSREEAGMAAGALSTMRYVGGVAGIAALGKLLGGSGALLARHQSAPPIYAVALALSGLAALGLPGRERRTASTVRPAA